MDKLSDSDKKNTGENPTFDSTEKSWKNKDENPTFDFSKKSWKDDVTFIIEEKRLYASKAVLAIVSPVFESMFGSDFKEKEQEEVPLPEKKYDDFKEFLHCIYSKSINCINSENALKVLPLADEYQVTLLMKECKGTLRMNLQDDDMNVQQLLEYYNVASRYRLSEIKQLALQEMLNTNESKFILNEAEKTINPKLLHEFKDDVIALQEKSLHDVITRFVKHSIMSSGNITGYENARGAVIEHQIENVLDPSLQNDVYSKQVKIWNAFFYVSASADQSAENEKSEKHLSLHLHCNLPGDGWSCAVTADIVLENVYAVKNKVLNRKTISKVFMSKSESSESSESSTLSWGFSTFEKLSKFLIGTPKNVENYSGKIIVFILANEPKQNI